MTQQVNLDKVWADTGGVTDPGDIKYSTGWVAEIPTYQNFNFVLQNHSKNLLSLAEKGRFEWEPLITYKPGAQVIKGFVQYTCILEHSNQDPELDTLHNYWILGYAWGADAVNTTPVDGLYISDINARIINQWNGNDITLRNENALIGLGTNDASDNLVLGNVAGELVVANVGTSTVPDDRVITPGNGSDRIFHEGHPPVQSEVAGTIPENPQDGKLYGRRDANWVEVTATVVQEFPPQPVLGNGSGWYNLQDAELYIDINDGDSSQWVPASNPKTFDIEQEIVEARGGRKNIIINGDMRVNQRGFDGIWANLAVGEYGYDRWKKSATVNSIDQVVEDGNYTPLATYILSGTNVTEQDIIAPVSGHWTITVTDNATKVQVELKSQKYPKATDFEYRSIGEEISLCQRYFVDLIIGAAQYDSLELVTSNVNATDLKSVFRFPTEMRALPSVAYSAPSDFIIQVNGSQISVTSIFTNKIHNKAIEVQTASSGSFPAGYSGVLRANSVNASIKVDAEL